MLSILKLLAAIFVVLLATINQPNLTWIDCGILGMLGFVFAELICIHETLKSILPIQVSVEVKNANTTGDAWS